MVLYSPNDPERQGIQYDVYYLIGRRFSLLRSNQTLFPFSPLQAAEKEGQSPDNRWWAWYDPSNRFRSRGGGKLRTGLSRYDWNFWLWWMVGTAAGATLGGSLVALTLSFVGPSLGDASSVNGDSLTVQLIFAPILAIPGFTIGALQWFILRSIIRPAGWWVLITGAGWFVGNLFAILLTLILPLELPAGLALILPWFAIGLTSGLGQGIFLRRHFEQTEYWVPLTTLGVLIGASGWIFGSICGGTVAWVAAGGLTGFLLLRMIESKNKS